jgi:choline dehydrogenase-like flavoprotein
MLQDARTIQPGATIECDVCVVGGGAAGIAIANHLTDSRFQVVVLESGGLSRESQTQALYAGHVVDPAAHKPLHQWRERRYGGTTTVWEGRVAPFDPIDFEPRDYVPHSGWPFPKEHLDRYYAAAHELCEAGALTYDLRGRLPDQKLSPLIEGFTSDELLTDKFYLFSPPTNFARRFAHLTSHRCRHRVLLHANCIGIQTDPAHAGVTHLKVACLSPRTEFFVRARYYILATGGLEVPRLLLACKIGNGRDVVGRFYQSHVVTTVPIRFAPPGRRIVWNYQRTVDGIYAQRAMALAPHVQRRERILNNRAMLYRPLAADPSHGNALLSALAIARALRQRNLAGLGPHAKNLLGSFPDALSLAARYARERLPRRRNAPFIVQCPSRENRYMLRVDAEQTPNPDSRMTLADGDADALGMPRLKVDWRYTELDQRNWRETLRLIADVLERGGAGRLEMPPQFEQEHRPTALAAHHLGAARMHVDPGYGVVDQNCRVHGVNNLFIASSAVFPTGSFANPTLTIIALALRLADHLNSLLS